MHLEQNSHPAGFKLWDKSIGHQMKSNSLGHHDDIHDDESARLKCLLGSVKARKTATTSGVRTPDWLNNLFALVDSASEFEKQQCFTKEKRCIGFGLGNSG